MSTPNLLSQEFQTSALLILPDDPESGTRATVANASVILRGLNEEEPALSRTLSL